VERVQEIGETVVTVLGLWDGTREGHEKLGVKTWLSSVCILETPLQQGLFLGFEMVYYIRIR
jgi:hypothetical protein